MKIAIASSGKNLDSPVDARFGRCPYYLIVDNKNDEFEAIENTAGQGFRGAGISAAQMVANKGVKAIIAGNFGPNAINVLSTSGIKIFTTSDLSMTAKKALEQYKKNELRQVTAATVSFGSGMGRGTCRR